MNKDFKCIYDACQLLIDKFEDESDRVFYEIKLFKTIKVYKEF